MVLIGEKLHPTQHFRCVSNGDYDELQCIGEKCYCVDATDGGPASDIMNPVNISSVEKDNIDCCEYKQIF